MGCESGGPFPTLNPFYDCGGEFSISCFKNAENNFKTRPGYSSVGRAFAQNTKALSLMPSSEEMGLGGTYLYQHSGSRDTQKFKVFLCYIVNLKLS